MRVSAAVLAFTSGLAAGCDPRLPGEAGADPAGTAIERHGPRAGSAQSSRPEAGLGEGFVVWESNRSGPWRIWTRELSVPGARQLTPNEPKRQHCCPHISPDGAWIAYLSLEHVKGYAGAGASGELRLIRRDGTEMRLLAERARCRAENRAVVWRSPNELLFVGDGLETLAINIDGSGVRELVPAAGEGERGWLLNAQLTHAVTGRVDFSPYDPSSRTVAGRRRLGGCQPYFSATGPWGFWTAGTGGPVKRIDLVTGQMSTILQKSDPRIPDGLGYVYFPMFSPDGRLFAFAASDYEHDHFKADYEVFVAESDPETLEILGAAVRMTFDPATDRFPDAYLEPLALGRHRGEAPLEVAFRPSPSVAGTSSTWRFDFGDGSSATATAIEHVYRQAGRYEVLAWPEDSPDAAPIKGSVLVRPSAAPKPVTVALADRGLRVIVTFDEDIDAERPRIEFESGRGVGRWALGEDGRTLTIEPTSRVETFDRITLESVSDRARPANWMQPATLAIEPPLWPSNRSGLAFLWHTADADNLILDESTGIERASTLRPTGGAWLDHDYAMNLGRGAFVAAPSDADSVLERCTATNTCSLEAVVRPRAVTDTGLRHIVSFSSGSTQGRNFVLGQRGNRLVFGPHSRSQGPGATPELDLGPVAGDAPTHVVVSHEVGRLTAFVNGNQVADEPHEGSFFHWKRRPLVMGNTPGGGHPWPGTLEGVAIYNRFVEADEARENHLRYREALASRPEVPRLVVEATLAERSPTPSLDEITPYREALAVFEYRIDAVLEGAAPPGPLRVAHWVILDGAVLEAGRAQPASAHRLVVEPFADNPQLESRFLADSLSGAPGPLYFSVSDE